MKHCCIALEGAIEDKNHSIFYSQRPRAYQVNVGRSFINEETGEVAFEVVDTLSYCPWCGKKFPKNLRKIWYDEIEALGFELPLDPDDYNKIPKEYMTDEWWKKKGL